MEVETSASKELRDYLSRDPDYRRLDELQMSGWNNPAGDRYFKKRRRKADKASPRIQKVFFEMMLKIGEELDTTTGAFQISNTQPAILDFCMAPGGFVKCALDTNPAAKVDAFSLPPDKGGHQVLIPHGTMDERISVHFTDVTMFAEEMGLPDDADSHLERMSLAPKWPCETGHYDLVICDGQVLRTHQREDFRVNVEPTRLTCTQLYLGLKKVRRGGTLVALLHRINTPRNFRLIQMFQQFSNVQLFKSTQFHTITSSFYLVARDIQPDNEACVEAMALFKRLWHHTTFGIDSETPARLSTDWALPGESSQLDLETFGSRFIELARPIWRIQEASLAKAAFTKGGVDHNQ